MRILVCNWRDLAHPHAGGAEVFTHEVGKAWLDQGHEVTLFCSAVEGREREEVVDGIRVIRGGSRLGVYRAARAWYQEDGRGQFDLVIDEVNTRPFFCHKWVTDADVGALVHQVAREIWFHELAFPLAVLGRYWLEPRWLRAMRTTPIATVSASSRDSLLAYGARRVAVIPQGPGKIHVSPRPVKEARPTVAFVGRLASNKRPADAIEAFLKASPSVPEAQMWVVGSGPLERALRRKYESRVTFFGHVDELEKSALMARSHLVLVTSVREGWGMVVSEAAAVGTRAVAYDVPGLRDSVPACGGVLCDPSPEALAAVLSILLRDATSQEALVRRGGGVRPWSEVAVALLRALAPAQIAPTGQA